MNVERCPCGQSELIPARIDYPLSLNSGRELLVPNLRALTCPVCGEVFLSPAARALVDKTRVEATRQPHEKLLQDIADTASLQQQALQLRDHVRTRELARKLRQLYRQATACGQQTQAQVAMRYGQRRP